MTEVVTGSENSPTNIASSNGKRWKGRTFLRGCLVLIWFALVLSPCLLIVLATQGEISVQTGSVPGQVFRMWLVDGIGERGIAISRPSRITNPETNWTCLQTNTDFILWMGKGTASIACDCYEQSDNGWVSVSSQVGECPP